MNLHPRNDAIPLLRAWEFPGRLPTFSFQPTWRGTICEANGPFSRPRPLDVLRSIFQVQLAGPRAWRHSRKASSGRARRSQGAAVEYLRGYLDTKHYGVCPTTPGAEADSGTDRRTGGDPSICHLPYRDGMTGYR